MRFTPGCKCCDPCDIFLDDQFNRDSLGSDWATVSGSWSDNGTQLTGSGELQWQPAGGLESCYNIKLDSGTLKFMQDQFFPDTYFQIGDGNLSYYSGGFLQRQVTGWPSTGVFKFCSRRAITFPGSMSYAISSGTNYDVFDGQARYAGLFGADSTVTVDWIENFKCQDTIEVLPADLDCCPSCSACESNAISANGVIIDNGVSETVLDVGGAGACFYQDTGFTWEAYLIDGEDLSGWDDKLPQARNVASGVWFLGEDSIDDCEDFEVTLWEQGWVGPFPPNHRWL